MFATRKGMSRTLMVNQLPKVGLSVCRENLLYCAWGCDAPACEGNAVEGKLIPLHFGQDFQLHLVIGMIKSATSSALIL